MSNEREFQVLLTYEERRSLEFPAVVPWGMLKPHERQAVYNHSQDLVRLNERGGLSLEEMWAALNDKPLSAIRKEGITREIAGRYIEQRIDQYEREGK